MSGGALYILGIFILLGFLLVAKKPDPATVLFMLFLVILAAIYQGIFNGELKEERRKREHGRRS